MATDPKQPRRRKRKGHGLLTKLADLARTPRERMIAEGTLIVADLSKQAPNNSYSYSPPTEYRDTEFTCRDCDKEEVWTAKQQQWWYEVAKGPINARAKRCRDCRRIDRLVRKAAQWPLSQKPLVVVMDTEDSRIRRMKKVLSKLDPEMELISRLTTNEWNQGFWGVLPAARFISLSCEWWSVEERYSGKPGEFLRILLLQRLRRPVLFHGVPTVESSEADNSLRRNRWKVAEVGGDNADWIESDWRDAVSSLLKLKNAG